MKFLKSIQILCFALFCGVLYTSLSSYSGGIVGTTKRTSADGCICHGTIANANVKVIWEGPASVTANDTATFKLKITGGPLVKAGTDIAAEKGNLILSPMETNLQRLSFNGVYELAHFPAKAPVNDTVTYTFRYVAPNTPNTKDTLYANGNSINSTGTSGGDQWNFAVNKILDITPLTSIVNSSNEINSYKLSHNYPNPFNPVTKINYSIVKDGFVSLKVYSILGKEIAVLVSTFEKAGSYEINFDLSQHRLSSGLYFYELRAGDFRKTRKMIVSK